MRPLPLHIIDRIRPAPVNRYVFCSDSPDILLVPPWFHENGPFTFWRCSMGNPRAGPSLSDIRSIAEGRILAGRHDMWVCVLISLNFVVKTNHPGWVFVWARSNTR